MFLLSIIFTRSIIRPIKTLSFLVKVEQDKFNPPPNTLNYPVRNDEIGGLSDNIKIHKIKEKDIPTYSKSLELSEGERYYHRDAINEPYWYDFKISSNHYHNSKDVFIYSINKLINSLDKVILFFLSSVFAIISRSLSLSK